MDASKLKQLRLQQDGRSHQKFKSPVSVQSKVVNRVNRESKGDILQQIEKAQKTCDQLDQEINVLLEEGLTVDELDLHIDTLHEYNEIKDATQAVLGRIAVIDGVTVKELHEKYGLDLRE